MGLIKSCYSFMTSGPTSESQYKYYLIDRIIPKLQRGAVIQGDPSQEDRAAIDAKGDYTVDEKSRSVTLTEGGVAKVERLLGVHNLYDPRQIDTLHHVQQALKAHAIQPVTCAADSPVALLSCQNRGTQLWGGGYTWPLLTAPKQRAA
jgi:hypothetical protein